MKYVKQILKLLRGLRAPFDRANAKTIILCLITASIFWFFNSLNKEYTTRINYPITFQYNQDSLISVTPLPKRISMNVTGGGWNLLRKTIGVNPTPLIIELENPVTQDFLSQYSLLNIATDQLEDFTVNFILTDTIFFDIDRKVNKKFGIKVDSLGIDLKENFEISSSIDVSPDSVLLTGPESIVSSLPNTMVINIPDTEIDDDYNEDIAVSLFVYGPVTSDPEKVNVNFGVEEYEIRNIDFNIERVNFPLNQEIILTKETVSTQIYIPISMEGEIDPMDFSIIADYANIKPADSLIELEVVRHPDFVKGIILNEPTVKVSKE